jgi:hypothetical protein
VFSNIYMYGLEVAPECGTEHVEHSKSRNQRRDTGADGSARYVDGTGRLPVRPPNDTYSVPEAPQSRVALEYRLMAQHRTRPIIIRIRITRYARTSLLRAPWL